MKQKGFSLIAVLVIGSVALLTVSGLIGFANANLTALRRAVASEQAFQAAEAGVEYYRWFIGRGGSLASPTTYNYLDRSGSTIGTYELTASPVVGGMRVVSVGRVNGARRTIEAEFIQGDGVTFNYGVQSGTGGFHIGNNSTLVGNVYSNSDITGDNGTSITGDAFAVGEVDEVEVSGQVVEGAPPQNLPISEAQINEWKDEADVTVINGNRNISGANNVLGPAKIVGNLDIAGGAVLTLNGTIWVTGRITLGNGAKVRLSSEYGARGGLLIADGMIDTGNNSILEGSGQPESSLMLITTSSSDTAIALSNNTSSVILYAPNGTIDLKNMADIKAVAAKRVLIGNNSALEYNQGLVNSAFTSGPSGGWERTSWKEID